MKILITGKNKKLAGSIFNYFLDSNKYRDVKLWNDVTIIPDFTKIDIFINCVHIDFCQTILLYEAYKSWKKNSQKLIINISSRAAKSNISKGYIYSAQKASLNHLADNLIFNSDAKFGIVTINLGLIEHDLPSISYKDICKLLKKVIKDYFSSKLINHEISLSNKANYLEVQENKLKYLKFNKN